MKLQFWYYLCHCRLLLLLFFSLLVLYPKWCISFSYIRRSGEKDLKHWELTHSRSWRKLFPNWRRRYTKFHVSRFCLFKAMLYFHLMQCSEGECNSFILIFCFHLPLFKVRRPSNFVDFYAYAFRYCLTGMVFLHTIIQMLWFYG